MTPDQVRKHYLSQAAAATAIGENRQTVNNWFKSGKIPLAAQIAWEVESGGAVRADIPDELRHSATEKAA